MSVRLDQLRTSLPSSHEFLAPVDSNEFDADPVSTSMLIEERRHTRVARQTIAGCLVLLVVLIGWASLAPVHEVVSGNGEILPVGLVQPVEHLEGGIVAAVHVEPGDRVSAGDLLVELDSASTREELVRAQTRLEALQLTIERQQNLANGGELRPSVDTMWLRLHDSQSEAQTSAEQYRDAQLDVLRAERSRLEAELAGVLLEQQSNDEELAIVNQQVAAYERALQSGAVSQRERDGVARDALSLQRERSRLASSADALRASIVQAEARESELVARLRQEALTAVSQLEGERAEAAALVRQFEDRQDRQAIVAPVDGIVNVINVRGPGDVISPADVVLELVPNSQNVFAQVDVPAERIGGIEVGMEASVKVLTYDFTRFGAVDAIVENVSASSVVREDGQSVFVVDLRLVDDDVHRNGRGPLQPGMTVVSDIVTGSRTVLEYLLKPMRVLSDRAMSES
ncbi:MAG: HlyD family type I secretion periplasmic adaptor subunit [Hyphomicrobiales bacterium]